MAQLNEQLRGIILTLGTFSFSHHLYSKQVGFYKILERKVRLTHLPFPG